MGEPTYFDGPDYPDGTDAEGFPGGDQRFGLIKPTKEEVESGIEEARGYNFMLNPPAAIFRKKYIVMAKAYLALREEVEDLPEMRKALLKADKLMTIQQAMLERSKAENQTLRAQLEKLQRYDKDELGDW